jgi:hypothetical protein
MKAKLKIVISITIIILLSGGCTSQKEKKKVETVATIDTLISSKVITGYHVTRETGGSIKTDLGYGFVLNKESSLQREWITIHNDSIPLDFVGTVGVKTIYDPGGRYSSGSYKYKSDFQIKSKQDLTAIETNFLVFDIWGNLIRNLSSTDILDLKSEETKNLSAKWDVYSENEVSEYYASIAYISQVRTKTGRVIKSDIYLIVQEAQKLSAKFNVSDLEPEPKKK